MERWPHQLYAFAETWKRIDAGQKRICLTSPTGGGKSVMICDDIQEALRRSWRVVLYTNRKMLITQLQSVLGGQGIEHGTRAAGHADERWKRVQVSSIQTENVRVLKSEQWNLHPASLAIIDEAHLNKGAVARQIIDRHVEGGCVALMVTATPIGLGGVCETLIQAGTNSELRKCGAIVPCYHYGPDEPDTHKIKRTKTGEFVEGDVRKAIMTATIFGRVYDHWKALNPDARPAIGFAPGVPESLWFCEQFARLGVRCAHIDGERVWVDGSEYDASQNAKEDIIEGSREGRLKILWNRFVLREGLDFPWLFHGIFATAFGSLQGFLQSAGRLLRAHHSIDRVILQDHGGNWHRHGSVNADRVWELGGTETSIREAREKRLTTKAELEPITCPECHLVRASGKQCPRCGHITNRKVRMVVQADGSLRAYHGDIYKPRVTKEEPNTHRLWKQIYFRGRHSGKTFNQCRGLFFKENGYWPSTDLPFMPLNEVDWKRKVTDVPYRDLTMPPKKEEPPLFEGM